MRDRKRDEIIVLLRGNQQQKSRTIGRREKYRTYWKKSAGKVEKYNLQEKITGYFLDFGLKIFLEA